MKTIVYRTPPSLLALAVASSALAQKDHADDASSITPTGVPLAPVETDASVSVIDRKYLDRARDGPAVDLIAPAGCQLQPERYARRRVRLRQADDRQYRPDRGGARREQPTAGSQAIGGGYVRTGRISSAIDRTERDADRQYSFNVTNRTEIGNTQILRAFGLYTNSRVDHDGFSLSPPYGLIDTNEYQKTQEYYAAATIEGGVRLFIFSSTAATYGMPASIPVREDAPQQPINPYGTSKLMTEAMLRDAAAAHPINFCALRYFNVAGADPAGRSGQSTAGATHLIKVAVEAATGKRGHVAVFGTDFDTPDGTGVRDYIHVSDLADAHVLALEKLIADPDRSHFMNCGYSRGFSVLEVCDAVDRVTNMTIDRRMGGRRPGDPDALVSDNARILATLPWTPLYADLDTIVRHALAWERKLGERG